MGVRAVCPSSQDLAMGVEFLKGLPDQTTIPFVCTNLHGADGKPMFRPSLELEYANASILILSVTGEYPLVPKLKDGFTVVPPKKAIKAVLTGLPKKDRLVILVASGIEPAEQDELANEFPDIHLFLGGKVDTWQWTTNDRARNSVRKSGTAIHVIGGGQDRGAEQAYLTLLDLDLKFPITDLHLPAVAAEMNIDANRKAITVREREREFLDANPQDRERAGKAVADARTAFKTAEAAAGRTTKPGASVGRHTTVGFGPSHEYSSPRNTYHDLVEGYYKDAKEQPPTDDSTDTATGKYLAFKLSRRATEHQELGQWQRADDSWTAAMKAWPDQASHYYGRGMTRAQLGDWKGAVADLAVAPTFAWDQSVWDGLREQHLPGLPGREAGLSALAKGVAANPKDARLWLARGHLHAAGDDSDQAEADYTKAVEADPTAFLAWFSRGCLRAEQGRWKSAAHDFGRAIDCSPEYRSGWQLNKNNTDSRFRHAWKLAAKAVACSWPENRDQADLWHHDGVAHAQLGEWELARAFFDKSIKLDPQRIQARHDRAQASVILGRWWDAIDDLTVVLKPTEKPKAEDEPDALHLRATAYLNVSQAEKAAADWSRCLQLRPTHPDAVIGRARAYLALKEFEKATKDFDLWLKGRPDDHAALADRAAAHAGRKEWPKATADITSATKHSSADDRTRYFRQRAGYFREQGKWGEAATDLRDAIREDEVNKRPIDLSDQVELAATYLGGGKTEAYGLVCRQLVAEYVYTEDALTAAWVAAACCLRADTHKDWTGCGPALGEGRRR